MNLEDILILEKENSGCDYHRIILPFSKMNYAFRDKLSLNKEDLLKCKCIHFNRLPLNINPELLVKFKQTYGVKIWMDLDDYWVLPKNHYLYPSWIKNHISEKIEYLFKHSDVVTCTTKRLANEIVPFTRRVEVIPNSLPFSEDISQFSFVRKKSEHTRFGFIGGTSHNHDIKTLLPIMKDIKDIDVTYGGYTPKSKESNQIKEVLSYYGKNKNYKSIQNLPLNEYMSMYDAVDVSFAPLEHNKFTFNKSNLKVLEAGIKKCAIICSSNPTYTDTVPDNIATYCKTPNDWKLAFKKYQDVNFAKEQGLKVFNWVKENYNMDKINELRLSLIKSL